MAYSDKVLDHYNHPRNVGSMDKNDPNVGTCAGSGRRPSGQRRRFGWPSCRRRRSTSQRYRSSQPRIAARIRLGGLGGT